MVHEFKTGKQYKFTGATRPYYWNSYGQMDFVLDNDWHTCVASNSDMVGCLMGSFEENPNVGYAWAIDEDKNLWEERT